MCRCLKNSFFVLDTVLLLDGVNELITQQNSYNYCHRRLVLVKVEWTVVVREQQRDNVEPNPEYKGSYKSQGYDDVSELNHDMRWEIVDFEGHMRVVRVPH